MISVLPVKEEGKVPLKGEAVFVAESAGETLGYFSLEHNNGEIWVRQIVVCGCENYEAMGREEAEIFELMVRTAVSYAMNRGSLVVNCPQGEAKKVLTSIGFEQNGENYRLFVEKMLHNCKKC